MTRADILTAKAMLGKRTSEATVAIVLGAVILAFGIVMGLTLHAPATGGTAP